MITLLVIFVVVYGSVFTSWSVGSCEVSLLAIAAFIEGVFEAVGWILYTERPTRRRCPECGKVTEI